jgi:hypothetical protein
MCGINNPHLFLHDTVNSKTDLISVLLDNYFIAIIILWLLFWLLDYPERWYAVSCRTLAGSASPSCPVGYTYNYSLCSWMHGVSSVHRFSLQRYLMRWIFCLIAWTFVVCEVITVNYFKRKQKRESIESQITTAHLYLNSLSSTEWPQKDTPRTTQKSPIQHSPCHPHWMTEEVEKVLLQNISLSDLHGPIILPWESLK